MTIKRIRPEVQEAIRRHQAEAIRPTREIVGRLVVRNGEAVVYERLKNTAKGDYRFIVHMGDPDRGLARDEFGVLVHSHPVGDAEPSEADLGGANNHWIGRPYTIYGVREDRVRVFNLKSRYSYEEIEIA